MVRRRLLAFVGTFVLAAGLIVALTPFDASISLPSTDGGVVRGTSHCGTPIRETFRSESNGGGWFAYAPGTSVIATDGFGCRDEARWHVALGTTSALLGAAIVLTSSRRRRPTRAVAPSTLA